MLSRFNNWLKHAPIHHLFMLIYAFNIFIRFSCIAKDLPPFSFCDEDIMVNNGMTAYGYSAEYGWRPGQFQYGAFNYYVPALVAQWMTIVSSHIFHLDEFAILCRILFPILIAGLTPSLVFLALFKFTKNKDVALGGGFISTFSPMVLGLSRMHYPDHYISTFSALILLIFLTLKKENFLSTKIFKIAGFLAGVATGIKYNAIYILFPIGCLQLLNFKFKNIKFWIKQNLVLVCFLIFGFLVFNFYVPFEFQRFLSDFKRNQDLYRGGISGGNSDHGIWMYFQYLYLTSFGILGIILYIIGIKKLYKIDPIKLIILVLTPVLYIIIMGKFKTNINRNVMLVAPFVLLIQGAGLVLLYESLKNKIPRLFALICLLFFVIEPITKSSAEFFHSLLPESRFWARKWVSENIPKNVTIGYAYSGWGKPIEDNQKFVQMPFPSILKENECLSYYIMDEWFYNVNGPGKSMYLMPYYSEIHFANASQHYPIKPPEDPHSKQAEFLKKFELIKEFGFGYYGPTIWIYRNKNGICPGETTD